MTRSDNLMLNMLGVISKSCSPSTILQKHTSPIHTCIFTYVHVRQSLTLMNSADWRLCAYDEHISPCYWEKMSCTDLRSLIYALQYVDMLMQVCVHVSTCACVSLGT